MCGAGSRVPRTCRERASCSDARFLVCTAVACILYLVRLNDTPLAIGGDEAFFANHGHALATTGRDLNGRMLPLVIQLDPDVDPGLWYQAMLVYLEAAVFVVLPFAEWSARLPVALLAIANIALLGMIAARYTTHPSGGRDCGDGARLVADPFLPVAPGPGLHLPDHLRAGVAVSAGPPSRHAAAAVGVRLRTRAGARALQLRVVLVDDAGIPALHALPSA